MSERSPELDVELGAMLPKTRVRCFLTIFAAME